MDKGFGVKSTRSKIRQGAGRTLLAVETGACALERALSRLLHRCLPARFRVTALVPVILLTSLALWGFASARLMDGITPWTGAGALLFEGCYLGRVLIRINALCRRHAVDHSPQAEQLRRLRGTVLPALHVLLGTIAFSVVFGHLSQDILGAAHSAHTPRLLWILTIGGLVLSLLFGDLMSRLIDIVELSLSTGRRNRQRTPLLSPDPGPCPSLRRDTGKRAGARHWRHQPEGVMGEPPALSEHRATMSGPRRHRRTQAGIAPQARRFSPISGSPCNPAVACSRLP